jgi:hypothetical protein
MRFYNTFIENDTEYDRATFCDFFVVFCSITKVSHKIIEGFTHMSAYMVTIVS